MSTKERPTPESDAETFFRNVQFAGGTEEVEVVPAPFARSLEKQRDELRETLGRFAYWTDGLLQDLPVNRDWLDPETENNLRDLAASSRSFAHLHRTQG